MYVRTCIIIYVYNDVHINIKLLHVKVEYSILKMWILKLEVKYVKI
jgi:hypothetical protein